MACALIMTNFARYKPHLSMILTQICYAIMFFIVEAAFNQGLNPYVYVTYRFSLAGLLISPFAYFLERDSRPKLTLQLVLKLFFMSIVGVGLNANMLYTGLRFSSPTLVSAVNNTISAVTFVIAILFRMEIVDVKSRRGIAKILGTLISLAGVLMITLYKGPGLQSLWDVPIRMERLPIIHENWVLGSILIVGGCLTWSSLYILQTVIMKKYPAKLSITAWMDCFGAAQSAVFAIIIQHKPTVWYIKMFSIKFWAITYSAVIGSGLVIFLQLWCIEKKGPVFTAMFNPLQTVVVVLLAYFVFGEKLYTGSILGGITVIIGLYVLLWGKERDQIYMECKEQTFSSGGLEVTEGASTSEEREVP